MGNLTSSTTDANRRDSLKRVVCASIGQLFWFHPSTSSDIEDLVDFATAQLVTAELDKPDDGVFSSRLSEVCESVRKGGRPMAPSPVFET
jgi:hypothetical protein